MNGYIVHEKDNNEKKTMKITNAAHSYLYPRTLSWTFLRGAYPVVRFMVTDT